MQPRKSYLVSATPRSGSTLFCELLNITQLAGHPKEYFEMLNNTGLPRQPQQYFEDAAERSAILSALKQPELQYDTERLAQWQGTGYGRYLERVIEEGTTPNGVFGAKMMWGYFDHFLNDLNRVHPRTTQTVDAQLRQIFPDLRYIWVTRQKKDRQVVSLWKAIQSQRWRHDASLDEASDATTTPSSELVFHFPALLHLERQIHAHEASWQRYFQEHNIEPLVILYEDFVQDREATLQKTLQYLGVELPAQFSFNTLHMKRQADELSEAWVQQYRQLKQERGETAQEEVA